MDCPEDRRTVHLGGHDGAGKDTATDGDHAGEWALLVDVGTLNGSLGRAEAQTDVLVPSPVAGVLARSTDLVVQEDVRLSRRISILYVVVVGGGKVAPASGKRARTGHCVAVSIHRSISAVDQTYVSSVAMVAVVWCCRRDHSCEIAGALLARLAISALVSHRRETIPGARRQDVCSAQPIGLWLAQGPNRPAGSRRACTFVVPTAAVPRTLHDHQVSYNFSSKCRTLLKASVYASMRTIPSCKLPSMASCWSASYRLQLLSSARSEYC